MYRIVVAISLFLAFSHQGRSQTCNCSYSNSQGFYGTKQLVFKNRIVICGYNKTPIDSNSWQGSAFIIKDCITDTIIEDNSNDGITQFLLRDCGDSLVEILLTSLPDSTMKSLEDMPLFHNSIKIGRNNKVICTPAVYCFNKFGISKFQEKVINNLCDSLELKIYKKDSNFFPYNEYSLHVLCLGAINENKRAAFLLQNIRKYFKVDGALSEVIDSELPYDAIMEHKNSNHK